MKYYLLMLICFLISNEIIAQGITKNGESTSTSTKFIDKNGKTGSIPMLNKNGQVFSLATLATTEASVITSTTAISGGNIINEGGLTVTARGICWSKLQNPTISGAKTIDGTGVGIFSSSITTLEGNTTYYVRAYATNSIGTAYGNQISFTTNPPTVPILAYTADASSITSTTATSGGNITSDGGASVTTRGVCWSTSQNPTVANSRTSDGGALGVYTSSITGLIGNTTYYVRAFATNSVGSGYGNEISFTTSTPTLPILTSTAITPTTSTSVNTGGFITSNGGANVTARGVCWNTSPGPTIANNNTSNGTGSGLFTSSISSLTFFTTYYIRAYATNIAGTAYGNEIIYVAGVGVVYQGGIIGYILQAEDPGYVSGEIHGLIVAPSDQSSGSITWCNGPYTTTGATLTAIGTGNTNTNTIIANQGTGSYAAQICADLVIDIYSDWYLPSKDELAKIVIGKAAVGNFAPNYYWTSTEYSSNEAVIKSFAIGALQKYNKQGTPISIFVRAVRSF